MTWLFAASLLWAFSFGLIKGHLTGLDPWAVAAVRLGLAVIMFAPWIIRRAPAGASRGRALFLGAVQFGAMYALYIASYQHLSAWQVAMWTVFTPLYVVLLDEGRQRHIRMRPLLAALLALAGAMLVHGTMPRGDTLVGILLVQGSNFCFAAGQLGYRPLATAVVGTGPGARGREAGLLGWMYLGATALTLVGFTIFGDRSLLAINGESVTVLLYLGLLPTAAGFWLWNTGAARTSAPLLAVANNLKVPLAVLVSWLVFQEAAPYLRAVAGLAVIMVALVIARPGERH